MFSEERALIEMFATLGTCVGLLSIVDSLVFSEPCAVIEALLTVPTFVGILFSMDSAVGTEVRTVGEAFPTLFTLIGLLTSVGLDESVENELPWDLSKVQTCQMKHYDRKKVRTSHVVLS